MNIRATMSEGVEISRVSVNFGQFRAVDNVSVDIRPGEFFSFLGPSGCGKTTILRAISGFLDPTEGGISIGGRPMKGIGPNKRPTALIFQNLALFPLMNVWENISFGLKVRGIDKAERRRRAEELLRIVDLPGAADKMVAQLSGGQKQRIAIARALAVEPKVMLLDEPLSALDLKLRQHMRSELRAIQERTKVTFIYITHDQNEALAMSDRVGVMSKGRLQQVDTPDRIYNEPVNGFVASFVGENSILEGGLEPSDGRRPRFTTADGPIACVAGPGLTSATRTNLYIRPETIGIGDDQTNTLPVLVSSVIFEGNVVSVIGRTQNGAELTSQFTNRPGLALPAVGEQIKFTFAADSAKVLKVD
ncbi:ABC transporter ATP-binding protein [Mesorhizobium sp.]|uniref:ABC transporter ATP-binding protein n=1 Tax=Mesorhizobium sp. TaxID=1871066 RepID=UPI00257A738C|nr:ABC transporter ATP-binding protein [Mesorhizobium sp.]